MAASQIVVENPTNVWLVVSAVAQAVAAGIIAWLTSRLVKFTREYVREMAAANRLQEQANRVSGAMLTHAISGDTPFLVATSKGGSGTKDGKATFRMRVENRGGGLAHDIEIDTTWGNAHIESLGAGDGIEVLVSTDEWHEDDYPQAKDFRFKDVHDRTWGQSPNQAPVQAFRAV